jgi:putative endopeptidase
VNLDWMSDSAKRSALRKLAQLKITLGVPEHPIDFSTMPLRRDSYVLNAMRAGRWFHDQDMKRLNHRVDRTATDPRQGVTEGTYVQTNNEVEFFGPGAKVIVPGVPDEEIDDAVLYGASFLAHEISHAFDSEGRHYDANGNRVDWWTPADEAAFRQRAQVLIDEYNAFTPVEGLHLNGETSLAENMADLVGLRVALDAFKQTEQFRKNELIDGFTPLQRFFLAYAYGRMAYETPQLLAATMKNGAYAPEHDRVNGVLMNIPEFYEAFGVRPGDRMFRAEDVRVKIW